MQKEVIDRRTADAEFRTHMQEHIDRFDREFASMKAELQALRHDVQQLTTLLQAGKIGGAFLRWSITVGTSAVLAYTAIRGLK
jgi:hypothetical protein